MEGQVPWDRKEYGQIAGPLGRWIGAEKLRGAHAEVDAPGVGKRDTENDPSGTVSHCRGGPLDLDDRGRVGFARTRTAGLCDTGRVAFDESEVGLEACCQA